MLLKVLGVRCNNRYGGLKSVGCWVEKTLKNTYLSLTFSPPAAALPKETEESQDPRCTLGRNTTIPGEGYVFHPHT